MTVTVASYLEQRGLRRARLVEMCTNGVFRERAIELSKQPCAGLVAGLTVTSPEQLATVNDVARRLVYGPLDPELPGDDQAPTGRKIADARLTEELTAACLGNLERSLPLRT